MSWHVPRLLYQHVGLGLVVVVETDVRILPKKAPRTTLEGTGRSPMAKIQPERHLDTHAVSGSVRGRRHVGRGPKALITLVRSLNHQTLQCLKQGSAVCVLGMSLNPTPEYAKTINPKLLIVLECGGLLLRLMT